jgi:hypothetical protein
MFPFAIAGETGTASIARTARARRGMSMAISFSGTGPSGASGPPYAPRKPTRKPLLP